MTSYFSLTFVTLASHENNIASFITHLICFYKLSSTISTQIYFTQKRDFKHFRHEIKRKKPFLLLFMLKRGWQLKEISCNLSICLLSVLQGSLSTCKWENLIMLLKILHMCIIDAWKYLWTLKDEKKKSHKSI